MQVCTLLQTDNHASTPPLSFLQAGCPSCRRTNSVKALTTSCYYVGLIHRALNRRTRHVGASDSTMTEAARAAVMCYNEDRSMTGFVSPDANGTCAQPFSINNSTVARECLVVVDCQFINFTHGNSADNSVEENSSVFSLIRMRWLLSSRTCR